MSHKFKIEIELPDKDYCNGCPVLNGWNHCKFFNIYIEQHLKESDHTKPFGAYIRPDTCKQNDKPEIEKEYFG